MGTSTGIALPRTGIGNLRVWVPTYILPPKQGNHTSPTVRTARTSFPFSPLPSTHDFWWLLYKIVYQQQFNSLTA
jgi:hypothetical protein